MFDPSNLSKLFDEIHIPLSYIPDDVYQTSVDWLHQHVPDHLLADFVFWSFAYILEDVCNGPGGDETRDDDVVSHYCFAILRHDNVAIFVAVAMLLRSRPYLYTRKLPSLEESHDGERKFLAPLKIWILSQDPQDNLSACLYSWVHNLLPLLVHSNPVSRHLILCFVEKILEKPDAVTELTDAPAWQGERLIPPPSFEILLRLTFPCSSARAKATSRFEAIYPMLKQVALAGATEIYTREMFRLCFRLTEEENLALAEEATDLAISLLTNNADDSCWKHWNGLFHKKPKASVALLKILLKKWNELSPSSRKATKQATQKLFICSLESAGNAIRDPILAKEALWSLTEIVGCCKDQRWDKLYKLENLDPSLVVFLSLDIWKNRFQNVTSYIRKDTPAFKEDTQQIFTSCLNLAEEVKEAASIALWPLIGNVDCWKLWDDLYTDNLVASAALLKELVDEWEFFSSALSGDTRALRKTVKSFMLKNKKARGANASLYRKADKSCQVIWRRLSPGSGSSLNGSAITAVVLFAAVAHSILLATIWWTPCSCTQNG
uniref:Uncharacterized protein n=1 Tax=Noccaea caerulescens TaxID=107243 RepID=A0A1J3GHM2_NOCCA